MRFRLLSLLVALGSCDLGRRADACPWQGAAELPMTTGKSDDSKAPPEDDELDRLGGDEIRRRDRPSGRVDPTEVGWLWRHLAGWGGVRQRLEDRGVGIDLLYSGDGSWVASGDTISGETFDRGLLELTLSYDTSATLGLDGGTAHASFQWAHGGDPSGRMGVLQPLSNVDADRRLQLGRIWYEQEFEASDTRVRVGKIDANSQFAFVESGAQFLHSSMGFSPTIFPMPSYPDASFGVTVVQSFGLVGARFGAFDGALARGVPTGERGPGTVFDGRDEYFAIGEVDATWATGRVAAGGWRTTADLARFDSGTANGTGGQYATAEQRVWARSAEGAERIDAFLQLGHSDREVSLFEDHLGLGLAWSSPQSPMQPKVGIGLSRVSLSRAASADFSASSETAVEMYYGFEPFRWVRVKPDLQWVKNPGGDASRADLWVATLRITLAI